MLRAIFSGHNWNENLMIALASGAACYVAVQDTKRLCRADEKRRTQHLLMELQHARIKSGEEEGSQVPAK
ncbi:hypothetical protein B9Z19DRAFT_1130368 [Tuber borchii]|uniref:Uncharacterized protein n=1 Tax=Tuber borchii TaxID=42251 RepID=A0A2T6ZKM2_TUBBO|nr:hypothetical protein B9Z19DRAFT_1130368 [Tuber borchii]